MWALSINYDYRTPKTFDQVSLATLSMNDMAKSLPSAMLASTIRGAMAAVSVLVFAGSDAGQDQNRAVIAPPQAKHRQWPGFGR